MNALCYKIVFSKRLGALVAVGEHTAGQGKAAGTGVRSSVFPLSFIALGVDGFVGSLKAVFASVALTFITAGASTAAGLAAPASNVLPTGYSVNAGKVAVTTSGAAMTIKQSTDKASLNWNSFSVGQDASVNVQQNNANSVLLNRVVGNEASQIFGKISANGQMVLINQNGIVFGKSGSVTSSAFTASTFNLSDDDFANGNYNYVRNGSKAGITNQGSIIATEQGGYIALIGANVSNEGSLKTVQGPVIMTAGDAVALPSAMTSNIQVPLSRKVRLELLPSTINAMVANTESGVITTDGGQVLMHAAAVSDAVANISANVVNSGKIDTTGVQGGAVTLQADDGYIKANGSITANSTGSDNNNQPLKGGDIIIGRDEQTGALAKATDVSGARLESNKGFVETSGQHLDSLGVNVKAAEWLLDPTNIEITLDGMVATPGNSGVKASDIATALNGGTSVTISTGTTGSSSSASGVNQTTASATNNAAGTIAVNSAITSTYSGSSNPTLTLSAASDISISAAINTSGSNIFLKSTGGAISNTAAITGRNVSIDNTGGSINASTGAISKGASNSGASTAINIAENIRATGNLNLYGQATGGIGINLANGKTISGANIQATGQSSGTFGALFGSGSVVTTGSSGDSLITGISTGGGSDAFRNSANLTAAANTSLTIDGQATNTGARGMRMEGGGTASGTVTIKGSSNNSTDGLISINGIITAAANSSLKLIGSTNKAGNVGVQLSNGGGVSLGSNATVEITGQSTGTTASGTGVLIQGWGISKATDATNTGLVKLTGTTASTSGSTGVAVQAAVSTDGNIDIQGNVVNAANTGIQVTAAVKSFGTTPTINLDATNGTITGAGAIGDTTNKNASVIITTAATSSFSGGINALNVTKAGAGTLTLDSWNQATPVMTNVSNSYNINAGRLNLNTGAGYYTVNTKYIYINNATTFGATGGSGTWSGNTFVFDANGGGTLAWGGNPIMNVGTAPLTFKSQGGATNNITGWFNMNAGSGVTFDVAPASTTSNPGLLLSGGNGFSNTGSTIVTKTGTGLLRVTNLFSAPTLNINAGTWEFGDGISNTGSTALAGGNAMNITVASGATLSYNTPSGMTINNVSTNYSGAGTILKKGAGVVQWGPTVEVTGGSTGIAKFAMGSGSLIDVQAGTFVASTNGNENWSSNRSSLNVASNATFNGSEGNVQVDALTGGGNVQTGFGSAGGSITVGVNGNAAGTTNNFTGVAYNATGTATFSGTITNIGSITKTGAGTQILTGTNTYVGTTTVNAGTLQIGNGGTTGTLGTGGAVTLTNGANLNFALSASTSISNDISGNGNINANITGTGSNITLNSNIALSGASGTQTNNAVLSTTGSIAQTTGKTLGAKNLYLTATNGGIGLSSQRINTSVENLSLNSAGSQYVTEVDAVTVAAKTTSNGNISILTTNGTMSIGGINGISGITANGTGDVDLQASSSTSHGIYSNQTIKGRNITVVANATSTSVRSLGYYGAGGSMDASEKLNLSGTSASEGNGFYIYSGSYKAGSGITITGTSLNGQGLGIEADATITNTLGNIMLTGSANGMNTNAIGLKGSKITNFGGNIDLKAINGNLITGKVNPAWFSEIDPHAADLTGTNTIISNGTGTVQITAGNGSAANSGAIDGSILSISQSTNGGDVVVSTSGTGNVTAPRITNAGTGNVLLAAGSNITAGIGAGGQVKTVSGNTVTQSNTGKTLIFTGSLADTDLLSNVDNNLTYLYASDVGNNKRNLNGNKAYDRSYSITAGAQAQAIFRQAIDLGTVDFSATVKKTYGDAGYTQSSLTGGASQLMTDLSTALAASDLNSGSLSGGNAANAIKFNKSTLVQQMALNSTDWNTNANFSSTAYRNAGSSNFIVNTASSDFTVVASGTETLAIAQAKLTEVSGSKTYDGQILSVTAGSSNGTLTVTGVNGETASLKTGESIALTSANAGNTSVTAAGISSLNNNKLNGSGIDLGNYDLSQAPITNNNVAIAKAKLTEVSGSKTYDGQILSVTAGSSNGTLTVTGVNGETASLKTGESIALTSANAGNTSVTAAGISSLNNNKLNGSGIDLGNYDLSQAPITNNNVAIAQAKLTEVSGSKTYDGNTNLSNGALAIKGVNGEEFNTDKSTIVLSSKNVIGTDSNGANSVINIANLTLIGKNNTSTEMASNYDLNQGSIINVVQITEAKLTEVTGAKVYDGASTIKSNQIASIKGINGEEFIAVAGTANISDKNVLTANKTLTDLSGLALTGKNDRAKELASNYKLSFDLPSVGPNNNVTITPKEITSDVFQPAVKSYDGSTKATTTVDTTNQVVATDNVKIKFDETSPTYDSAVIGTGKKVTITGVALSGNDASNYSIASTVETKKNTINAASPAVPVRTPAVTTSSSKSTKSSAASTNPFQLASAEVEVEEENVCSTGSAASCKCESSSSAPGVSICYSAGK